MAKRTLSASVDEEVIKSVEKLRKHPDIKRNRSEMVEILLSEALASREKKKAKKL